MLCKANTTSEIRSGMRMVRQYGKIKFNLHKVLVTSIYGHDDLLDYFSDFRTQDKMHGTHYYPKGALCWFETDQYGDLLGSVYFARRIPVMEMLELPMAQRGLRQLRRRQLEGKTLKEIWTKQNKDTDVLFTVKPKTHNWQKGE